MRIAVSGAHATGKSTLIAELADRLPGYRLVEEPYHAMVAEGYVFPAHPDADDYDAQLTRSVGLLAEADESDVVFDRCPADFLAYLAALPATDSALLRKALAAARAPMGTLDLVVYVPIESPDRIAPEVIELRRMRRRVDDVLRDMLIDDAWGLAANVFEVRGTPAERARQIVGRIAANNST